jgi:Rha family phage regulatory protein
MIPIKTQIADLEDQFETICRSSAKTKAQQIARMSRGVEISNKLKALRAEVHALENPSINPLDLPLGSKRVSSRFVAEKFGKRHADVMRAIRVLLEKDPTLALSFALINEISDLGDGVVRNDPVYSLDREAFTLLVMGFRGEKALRWKRAFIKLFEQLENIAVQVVAQLPDKDHPIPITDIAMMYNNFPYLPLKKVNSRLGTYLSTKKLKDHQWFIANNQEYVRVDVINQRLIDYCNDGVRCAEAFREFFMTPILAALPPHHPFKSPNSILLIENYNGVQFGI